MEKIETKKVERKGFWHLVAEPDLFDMVLKSGHGEYEFKVFQKRRLRNSLIAAVAGAALPTILISPWLAFSGLILFLYTWRNVYAKEKKVYDDELYEKQISWYAFQRLTTSFVSGDGAKDSIFVVFGKVLSKLVKGEFKESLKRLMVEITEESNELDPYIRFAKNGAGGTDSSLTFMMALYNFRSHTHDKSIINELTEIARKDMERGIYKNRKIKERHFYFFPTKLTLLNTIPMIGFFVSVVVYVFTNNMSLL